MTREEIVKEARRLTIVERQAVVAEIERTIREEVKPKGKRVSVIEELYGIGKPNGPMPSDEELKHDYIRYLTEKYS